MESTNESKTKVAQQIAMAAVALHHERTGHAPRSATVVLGADMLAITLHGALSPAEQALIKSVEGADQVQKFHSQLFASSCESLRQQIKKITGVEVKEAVVEVETTSGAVVQVFTTGNMVQVFQLKQSVPMDAWSGNGNGEQS